MAIRICRWEEWKPVPRKTLIVCVYAELVDRKERERERERVRKKKNEGMKMADCPVPERLAVAGF